MQGSVVRGEGVQLVVCRAGEGCECWLIKSTVKDIQVVGQLMVLQSVRGWSPTVVTGDELQVSPH